MKFFKRNKSNSKNSPSVLNLFKRFKAIHKASKASNPVPVSSFNGSSDDAKEDPNAEDNMTERDKIIRDLHKNSSNHFLKIQIAGLKRALRGPAGMMTTGSQLKKYALMHTSAKDIKKNNYAYLIGMIVAFLASLFVLTMMHEGSFVSRIVIGLVVVLAIWGINYMNVNSQYKTYVFKNQLRFQEFGTVLDLSELKRGFSIVALLDEVAGRFDRDPILANAIRTMVSRIQDKPESPEPYLAFTNKFSTTQRARLFMLSVYRMAQGNLDDSQIKDIKHSASNDLTYQSEVLMHKKEARFRKLWFMQFTGVVLHIIVYVLFFIGLDLFDSLKGVGF